MGDRITQNYVAEGVIIITLTDPDERLNLEMIRRRVESLMDWYLNKRIKVTVEARAVERA